MRIDWPRDTMPLVAVVPARDEGDRVVACLQALDHQLGARLDHIVLLVNNSRDQTACVARSCAIHPATILHVLERELPLAQANAGTARSLAMEAAADLAGADGVLLTTDADGQVDPVWLAATLRVLASGADVVAGWVDLHPAEAAGIPAQLHAADAEECAYDALCDEIHARLDPDPADPMPRHTQNSGASIAVTSAIYARSGGVPAVPSGEDRAFIAALRRVDARIRHAPEVHVAVSGRVDGRSPGGMADTIRRRLVQPDEFLDDRLEPVTDCVRRARCRAELRQAYVDPTHDLTSLGRRLALAPAMLSETLRLPYFGAAWQVVEQAAPVLAHQRVAVADLQVQTDVAQAIVATLRLATPTGPADRSDSRALEAEDPA